MLKRLLAAVLFALSSRAAAGTLEIASDARVDLVGVVQQLAGNDPIDGPVPDFRKRAMAHFEKYKDHPVVAQLKRMSAKGFTHIAPAQYVLYFGDVPALKPKWTPPGHFARAAGGQAELDAFDRELRDFAVKSNFMEWYASQSTATAALVDVMRKTVEGVDIETPLVKYLGMASWERWVIVPSYFYPDGAWSCWVVEEKPGLPHIYVVVGPSNKRGGGFDSAAWVAEQAWPEAIYSTTYFMYELCFPEMKLRENVCDAVPGFEGNGNCLQILWVQAMTSRLLRATFGAAYAKEFDRRKLPKSKKWTDRVEDLLEVYEKRRDLYPRMVDYTPELAASFSVDGKRRDCRLIDRARFDAEEYSLQLGVYLDSTLALKQDAGLEAVRTELRATKKTR